MGALHSESSRWSSRFVFIGATLAIAVTAASGSRFSAATPPPPSAKHSKPSAISKAEIDRAYGKLPVSFAQLGQLRSIPNEPPRSFLAPRTPLFRGGQPIPLTNNRDQPK